MNHYVKVMVAFYKPNTNNSLKQYWEGQDASKYSAAVEQQAATMKQLCETKLIKNVKIQTFYLLINKAKLIALEKNKIKEEKNRGKKITFRFQGIKVLKKKSRKDIFRPLVNIIQLKNEMKNKFIYWKKLTKEKEMESSSQENENENSNNSFIEKTCKMQ